MGNSILKDLSEYVKDEERFKNKKETFKDIRVKILKISLKLKVKKAIVLKKQMGIIGVKSLKIWLIKREDINRLSEKRFDYV